MPSRLSRSIADSIDAPVAALPWIPELLADLDALGSHPRTIARWLGAAGLGPSSRVLDLGCGKGAAAIQLATQTGCRVLGIDAFAPFIASATAAAADRRVAHLCHFHRGDARAVIPAHARPAPRFDAALMIGLFDLEEAASILRPFVRPGGVYLLDDCITISRGPIADDAPLTRAEAQLLLQEHGDTIEREIVWTPSQIRRSQTRILEHLARRTRAIVRRDPRSNAPLADFLRRQRAAAADLLGPVRPAMWLVRKRRSGSGR